MLLSLQALCSAMRDVHILVKSDNRRAVALVNHMGGMRSMKCQLLTLEILNWCVAKGIWITAAYIGGSLNIIADGKSGLMILQSRHYIEECSDLSVIVILIVKLINLRRD